MPEYEKHQQRDYGSDQIKPSVVHEHLRAHDKRMRESRGQWALTKASYTTNFWKHVRGGQSAGKQHQTRDNEINVEVNRLFGIITSYLAALYPRMQRAVVLPDPEGLGDSSKTELALNRFMESSKIHQRIMTALRQALLYPGAGAKIGYYAGRGNPLDRVWMRIIPYWEMVLDSDVGDQEDERFRGHVYFRPKADVEEEYGLTDLKGTERTDYLRVGHTDSSVEKSSYPKQDKADSDNSYFVRVLEICNMKDNYEDKENSGILYEGRLEIYVLGQGRVSQKPVYVGPLPFAEKDGRPMAHIIPLIFNHEPEYPLRGIAHAQRILPQIQELNAYRSFMAMATRKDTRQYITRKGTFGADELTDLTEGHDGLILQLDQDYDRPLGDAIAPIGNLPISSNINEYLSYVESDLERSLNLSPSARGQVTKATAFEIQAVQQYTESEFGLHATIKDEWLTSILRVVLRALISSMQDLGESSGAFEGQDVQLANVGAISNEDQAEESETQESGDEAQADGEEQVEAAEEQESDGEQEPYIDDDSVDDYKEDPKEPGKIEAEKLILRDRRDFIEVGVEDLDAEFAITFVEGVGAPMEEAVQQQNLLGLLEPYTSLWQLAQKGDSTAFLARQYMKTIADKFGLPKDLHPDELDAKIAEQAESEESAPEDKELQEAAAPPTQQPAEADLSDIASMPPDQAILAMREIFANDPEMQQVLDQLETLPPEQKAQMIAQMLTPGETGAPV